MYMTVSNTTLNKHKSLTKRRSLKQFIVGLNKYCKQFTSIWLTKTVLYYLSCIGYLGFERNIVNLYFVEKKIFVNDKNIPKDIYFKL